MKQEQTAKKIEQQKKQQAEIMKKAAIKQA